MTKLKTFGLLGAMLLGASSLAYAQTAPSTSAPSTGAPTVTSPTVTSPTVSPPTGGAQRQQATKLTEMDVKKKLEAAGYSSVTGIKQDKNGYTAMAMKNGKQVKVDIDANGNVETMN